MEVKVLLLLRRITVLRVTDLLAGPLTRVKKNPSMFLLLLLHYSTTSNLCVYPSSKPLPGAEGAPRARGGRERREREGEGQLGANTIGYFKSAFKCRAV